MECFYRKKGGARELLTKKRKDNFGARNLSFREREKEGFLPCRLPLLSKGHPEGPKWLIRLHFCERLK